MKNYLFIVLFTFFLSSDASSQNIKRCDCKTWKEWNTSNPIIVENSRRERVINYENYKRECIAACKKHQKGNKKNQ